MDREFFRRTLWGLWFLTFLDVALWIFKIQTAVFFTVFILIPLWTFWIWLNPYLEDKKEET